MGVDGGATVVDNRLAVPLAEVFSASPSAWDAVTGPFLASDAGRALCEYVDRRMREGAAVYPSRVLRALELTAPADVRIVILGQDPYHGPGQAQGLAFSVATGQRVPPSLRNILQEVATDIGAPSLCRDDLTPWAQQGVLLLNSVLTVEDGMPQSHAGKGWEVLTDALLAHVAALPGPVVFMLWGAAAQKKQALLDPSRHGLAMSNHPSPLSARRPPRPFVGSRPFAGANRFLLAHGRGPAVRW